jgi:hypothetical protein
MRTRSAARTRTKTPPTTAPALDDVLSSWVLDALRRVLGYEDIRNLILRSMVDHKGVAYGKTFGAEHTVKQLEQYLKTITTGKTPSHSYLLFTASNQAYQGETHYQSFVVDYAHKKLWVLDPASAMGREGIYAAYVARDTIMPFFQKKGWDTAFVKLTKPCQSTEDDIFCQTWSLWLQSRFVRALLDKKKTLTLSVPAALRTRYKDLLRFYKESIALPEACKELTATYRDTIRTSPALVLGATPAKAKEIVRNYLKVDPCQEVLRMNELDLMTTEQRHSLTK